MKMGMRLMLIRLTKCLMVPIGTVYLFFKTKSNITILMYHRVNDSVSKEISVSKSDFLWQMKYLKKNNYHVISIDRAICLKDMMCSRSCRSTKEKYVVLTFDDGYEDYYTTAYPILSQFGYPSIIYLVPGFVETGSVFWWDRDLGESRLMDWKQIEELKNSPLVQFGCHSMTHPDFDRIEKKQAEEELVFSQRKLEEKLSLPIKHFSYPRGIVTKDTRNTVKVLYETGVSIFDGDEISSGSNGDHMAQLKRMPIQRSDGRCLFGARLKGWLVMEEWIKKILGRH